MRKNKTLALGLITVLAASSLLGCGSVDWAKSKVNEKIGDVMVGKAEIVETISADRYAYGQLNREEQIVYDQMLHCIMEHQDKLVVSTKDDGLLQKAYDCMMADYGELFWITGYQYNTYKSMDEVVGIEFCPQYIFTKEQRAEYQTQVDQVVDEWMANLNPNSSEEEKSKYVFETLINNVEYVAGSENNQNILSVFLGRETVCQGYADATQYLLHKLGIQSMIIRGHANNEAHAWNLVQIDGEYYQTDTTWGNSRYIMGDNTIQKKIDYHYLNADKTFIDETHVVEMPIALPN